MRTGNVATEGKAGRFLLPILLAFAALHTLWILLGAPPTEQRQITGYLTYLPLCALSATLLFHGARRAPTEQRRGWTSLRKHPC